jgi:hypothetical protein
MMTFITEAKNHIPVITMHGAKSASFIICYCVTYDNFYYRNKNHAPVIAMHGAETAPLTLYLIHGNIEKFY